MDLSTRQAEPSATCNQHKLQQKLRLKFFIRHVVSAVQLGLNWPPKSVAPPYADARASLCPITPDVLNSVNPACRTPVLNCNRASHSAAFMLWFRSLKKLALPCSSEAGHGGGLPTSRCHGMADEEEATERGQSIYAS